LPYTSGRLSVAAGVDCAVTALSEWARGVMFDAADAGQDVNLDIGEGISTQTDIIFLFACSATSMIDELPIRRRPAALRVAYSFYPSSSLGKITPIS